jgi:ATP-dependent DNA ligase
VIFFSEISNSNMNTNQIRTFPKLFGSDVKGKTKEWNIVVINNGDHSVIEIEYGYVSGKMTKGIKKITHGKNIGKRNQTTHFEQAVLEAQSKWKKKTEQEFSKNISDGMNKGVRSSESESDSVSESVVVFPMLASDFQKFKNKIKYPVYIQPKLDGYRMIFNSQNKSCNSRQGKPFDAIKRNSLYKELCCIKETIILDGELYQHGGVFEHLGILRKKKLDESDYQKLEQIEYHVYDYVDKTKSYKDRLDFLKNFFTKNSFQHIRLVETHIVSSENEVKDQHLTFVKDNYEGSIIRTVSGKYRCKARSQDLLKFKDFIDSEYKIVGFTHEQDTASNKDLVIWICINENGDKFNVRPKGTREERNKLYQRGQEFIGQRIQVKYFELTDSGIPRFPTTKSESYETYIRNIVE